VLKGTFAHRVAVCCPVCRLDEFRVTRRLLSGAAGRVIKRCLCQRCGSTFEYEEDKTGKPLKTKS
jgi:transposase-like protein